MVFKKFDVTKFAGINSSFDIYINDTKQIIYKKVKRKKVKRHSRFNLCKKDFHEYKNIILDIHNQNFCAIKGFDVEDDGSYKCKYIDGFTLYQIRKYCKKDINIIKEKSNIINSLENFKSEFFKKKNRSGDWHINNLIYSLEDKKIYNIDLEGYFTYKSGINNDRINVWINIIKKNLL
jgi:hypothetical protein